VTNQVNDLVEHQQTKVATGTHSKKRGDTEKPYE